MLSRVNYLVVSLFICLLPGLTCVSYLALVQLAAYMPPLEFLLKLVFVVWLGVLIFQIVVYKTFQSHKKENDIAFPSYFLTLIDLGIAGSVSLPFLGLFILFITLSGSSLYY